MNQRRVTRLPIAPGPSGVVALHESLRAVLTDDADPIGLVPISHDQHSRSMAAGVKADAPARGDEVGVILATSGSTGEPRGVLLSRAGIRAAVELGSPAIGPLGHWLTALPVTSVGGLMTVARAIVNGTDPIAWAGVGGAERFTAESFTLAAEAARQRAHSDGVQAYTSLVPTQLTRLLRSQAATDVLASFGKVLVGGAALPPRIRAMAQTHGIDIVTTYGATETCGGIVYDGVPLSEVQIDITGSGTIAIGGPTLALGYRFRPDLDDKHFVDGRFITADHGRWVQGQLEVTGRVDNVIKVGGVKVSTAAITESLLSHPRVLAALTVAVPDAEWGLVPVVYVVTDKPVPRAPGALGQLKESLVQLVSGREGHAARPREVIITDALPELPSGKAGVFGGTHEVAKDTPTTRET
jgi:O-succinylbenzoic acid--CoA ligase